MSSDGPLRWPSSCDPTGLHMRATSKEEGVATPRLLRVPSGPRRLGPVDATAWPLYLRRCTCSGAPATTSRERQTVPRVKPGQARSKDGELWRGQRLCAMWGSRPQQVVGASELKPKMVERSALPAFMGVQRGSQAGKDSRSPTDQPSTRKAEKRRGLDPTDVPPVDTALRAARPARAHGAMGAHRIGTQRRRDAETQSRGGREVGWSCHPRRAPALLALLLLRISASLHLCVSASRRLCVSPLGGSSALWSAQEGHARSVRSAGRIHLADRRCRRPPPPGRSSARSQRVPVHGLAVIQ